MHFQASNCIAFPAWEALERLIWTNDLYLTFRIKESPYPLMIYLFFFFFSSTIVLPGLLSSLQCCIINTCHCLRKKTDPAVPQPPGAIKEWQMTLSKHCPTSKNNSRLTGSAIWREVTQPWWERISFCSASLSIAYAFPLLHSHQKCKDRYRSLLPESSIVLSDLFTSLLPIQPIQKWSDYWHGPLKRPQLLTETTAVESFADAALEHSRAVL